MIPQRHPSERVTPVEVGDPIQWTTDAAGVVRTGRTAARGCWYVVAPRDDVWEAVRIGTVMGHGGPREHREQLRLCQTQEAALAACQDAEHTRAWMLLSDTARALLLGLEAVAA